MDLPRIQSDGVGMTVNPVPEYALRTCRRRNLLILEVDGELNRLVTVEFYRRALEERPIQSEGLVIDLSRVHIVDSAGVGVCVRLLQEMKRLDKGGAIVIKADGTMDSVVAFSNLHRVAPIFRSQEEAIRCLASPQGIVPRTEQLQVH
jgi:anti-anti-sigma factor